MVHQCQVCGKLSSFHPELSFHRFPVDPERKSVWLSLTGISCFRLPKHPEICSKHFHSSDLIMKANGLRYVKPGANPKLVVDLSQSEESTSDSSDSSIYETPPRTDREENISTSESEVSKTQGTKSAKQPRKSMFKIRTGITGINQKTPPLDAQNCVTTPNILKEHNYGRIKKHHKCCSLSENVSDDERNQIRLVAHSFFLKHELPTMEKIQDILNENEHVSHLHDAFLTRLLHEIHFRFKGTRSDKFLKEKDETIICRRSYLSNIKEYRKLRRPIYYVDETWIEISQNMLQSKRFKVSHIGNRDGFINNGLLVFESDDCNVEATEFEEWFSKILPLLKDDAVVVLHDTPCHNQQLEKLPNAASPKIDIQKWLSDKGIPFKDDMVRVELLDLVRKTRPTKNRYVVDEIAEKKNKTILRMPAFHYELNPLKSIWTQIKPVVEVKSSKFQFRDTRSILIDAIDQVDDKYWQEAYNDVEKAEKEMWQLDVNIERLIESLLQNCSSSESGSESE